MYIQNHNLLPAPTPRVWQETMPFLDTLFLIPKKPFKSKKGFAVFVVHLCLATSHSSPLHLFSFQHPEESLHVQQGEDGITTKQFILSADR